MPLAFPSRSHGVVAFGFFQIEIDMLLLEQRFFFADRFAAAVVELAGGAEAAALPGWRIADPSAVGDVNRAIRGADLGGFIGATYRRFPFPRRPEGFKQKPDGQRNRGWAAELIGRFGVAEEVRVRADAGAGAVAIGEYVFDDDTFGRLVAYVDRGGYPRWEHERRPAYVVEMMATLAAHRK